MELPKNIQEFVKPMFGKICCRQRVWKPRSLWFGFGDKLYHTNQKLIDAYYGEWEIGTYYGAWRIIRDKRLLCASNDLVDSVEDLQDALNNISFGQIISLRQPTNFDVRAEFDTGIAVDFLTMTSDEDECFGILNGPDHIAAEFKMPSGWTIGSSNKPWTAFDTNTQT